MKKSIALILALTLLALGSYLGFGLLARKNYEVALAELQANYPGQIDSSYSQGLFTSELKMTLHIPIPPSSPNMPESVAASLRQTVHHGPFIFSAQTQNSSRFTPLQVYAHGSFEIEPFMTDEPSFVAELRQLATTEITVQAPINGAPTVSFIGNPRHIALPIGTENLTINWQGFAGTLLLESSNLLSYNLDFRAPGLKIKSKGPAGIIIKEITTQAKMREGSHNLSLGTIITTIEACEAIIGSGPEEKISLTGLNVRITNNEKDQLLRVEEEINLDNLQFADKKYGPGNLKMSLNNLDAQAVSSLSEAFRAMQINPTKSETMALEILSNHATALLASSPAITIDNFFLASPEGACQSKAHVAFNGEGEVIMNPLFLLGRLSAEANFSADEHFLAAQTKNFIKEGLCAERPGQECDQEASKTSSKQLKALVEQNILQLSKGKYTLNASFKNGQTMLNGQAIPLAF